MKIKLHSVIETPFPLWDKLLMYRAQQHAHAGTTKKVTTEIKKAAKLWLPYEFYKAPWGDFFYVFDVEMEMERRWNFREFREGRKFGRNPKKPHRDANPYADDTDRRRSWDCGYVLGVWDYTLKVV